MIGPIGKNLGDFNQLILHLTTVRLKSRINSADYHDKLIQVCIFDSQVTVLTAYFQTRSGSKSVKLCRVQS